MRQIIQNRMIFEQIFIYKQKIEFMQKKSITGKITEFTLPVKKVQQKKLNQIIELTEENQTCRVDNQNDIIQQYAPKSCLTKTSQCLKQLFYLFKKKEKLVEVDVNQSQVSRLIQKLRNKKEGLIMVLPPPVHLNRKTLVLDLDQTLIYSTFNKPEHYDFETQISTNSHNSICYTSKRFGIDNFLFEMSQIYEIVIFTAGQRKYADLMISKIDPKGWISHRLYREHCIVVNKTYYLKNLRVLGRDLKNVVMVDDNRMGGILQPDNYYRIQPFMGSQKDRKLVRLGAFLKHLNQIVDVKPVAGHRKRFQQTEIKLKQNIGDNNNTNKIQERRKLYKHKKTNSETQSLASRDQNQTTNTESAELSAKGFAFQ